MSPALKLGLSASLLTILGSLLYWTRRNRHTTSTPDYPKSEPLNEGGNSPDWFELKRQAFTSQPLPKKRLLELLQRARSHTDLEKLLEEAGISEEQFVRGAQKFKNDEEIGSALLALDESGS